MTFDVPSAYLKAYKDEDIEICLRIPEGMTPSYNTLRKSGTRDASDMCLCLLKKLYDLKPSGRLSNQLLNHTLMEAVYLQSVTDACVY